MSERENMQSLSLNLERFRNDAFKRKSSAHCTIVYERSDPVCPSERSRSFIYAINKFRNAKNHAVPHHFLPIQRAKIAARFILFTVFCLALLGDVAAVRAANGEPVLTVQTGHLGPIAMIAVAQNDETLLTAGADGFAQQWKISSGRVLRRWPAGALHNGRLSPLDAAALSADGKFALTADALGWVNWRTTMTGQWHQWNAGGRVIALALTADGKAVAATARALAIWEPEATKVSWSAASDGAALTALALSPDEKTVAVGDERGKILVYDVATGRKLSEWNISRRAISGLAFGGRGARLLVANGLSGVTVWNEQTGESLGELVFPRAALSFMGNNEAVVGAFGAEGELMFASVDTGRAWQIAAPAGLMSAVLVPKTTTFLAATSRGEAQLCDIYRGSPQRQFSGEIEFAAAARWLASGVLTARGAPTDQMPVGALEQNVMGGFYNSDGRRFAAWTDDGKWRLWRAETASWRPLELPTPLEPRSAESLAVFSADGARVFVAAAKGGALFSAVTAESSGVLKQNIPIQRAAFSPDSQRLATPLMANSP